MTRDKAAGRARPKGRAASARPSPRARPRPGPRGGGSDEHHGRQRILAVAIRSFSQRGYEGTTTAGIARDAGVTQPLIHHHFGSKEGLWQAAMEELFAGVRDLVPTTSAPPTDRLLDLAEQFVRFVAARPEVTRVITREGAVPNARLEYLVDRYLRLPFRAVVDAIEAGQRAGVIAPEARADLFLFLMLGAGSHFFDVTALARESLGVDASSSRTRDDFVALMRLVLSRGVFRSGGKV